MASQNGTRLGWLGTGRMGYPIVARLLEAGHDVAVYNRTREKAEPLAELGATVVDEPAALADREIVFTIVGGSADFEAVTIGESGLLSRPDAVPRMIVDSTTISAAASKRVREAATARGTAVLAAPVSGNPNVVAAGRLTVVVSGPRDAWEDARPYLERFGAGATYVGEGDSARLVKICHNVMLGVVAQCMAEVTVLAEKAGIARADFLEFLNGSVMGSLFTAYKTPAYVNLDFEPTFTSKLLLKDLDLGLDAAGGLSVPMPLAAAARQLVQGLIGSGYGDVDFAALLATEAAAAGLELEPEDTVVPDGLGGQSNGAAGRQAPQAGTLR